MPSLLPAALDRPRAAIAKTIPTSDTRVPTGLLWAPLRLLLLWQGRASQRNRLAELDARLLADMGLTREEARAEAAKPFWRE